MESNPNPSIIFSVSNLCIDPSGIRISCSCHSALIERCAHQDICTNNGVIVAMILDILACNLPACPNSPVESANGWRAIVLGKRGVSTSTVWLDRFISSGNSETQSCVPVVGIQKQSRLS